MIIVELGHEVDEVRLADLRKPLELLAEDFLHELPY